jgi:hypothetical protein
MYKYTKNEEYLIYISNYIRKSKQAQNYKFYVFHKISLEICDFYVSKLFSYIFSLNKFLSNYSIFR